MHGTHRAAPVLARGVGLHDVGMRQRAKERVRRVVRLKVLRHVLGHGRDREVGRAAQALSDPLNLAGSVDERAHDQLLAQLVLLLANIGAVRTRRRQQRAKPRIALVPARRTTTTSWTILVICSTRSALDGTNHGRSLSGTVSLLVQ